MKTQSDIKPENEFEIKEHANNKCDVLFFTNIEEIVEDDETIYKYDLYRLPMRMRNNLKESIESNYDKWLEFAKTQEENKLTTKIREKRDKLLSNTDWTQMQDTALSDEKVEEYKTYRQALRDITAQDNFPYKVEFPSKPS